MVNYVTLDFLKDARAEGSERTNEQINMNENGWMNDFVSSSPNFQLEHCIRTLVETRCRLETVLTSAKGLEQGFFPLERIDHWRWLLSCLLLWFLCLPAPFNDRRLSSWLVASQSQFEGGIVHFWGRHTDCSSCTAALLGDFSFFGF